MIRKFLPYAFLVLLLASSMITFSYSIGITSARAAKRLLFQHANINTYYTTVDQYTKVDSIAAQYPQYPIYFVPDSPTQTGTKTSWQMFQTYYHLYPRIVTELSYQQNSDQLKNFITAKESAIIVSPFKQNAFAAVGTELHPHPEYYLYIITKK